MPLRVLPEEVIDSGAHHLASTELDNLITHHWRLERPLAAPACAPCPHGR